MLFGFFATAYASKLRVSIQHRAVLIISSLFRQSIVTEQMLSDGRKDGISFQAQNSSCRQIFSDYSLLAPTWTAFSDYTGPDILCLTVFHFFFFFSFGSCGRLSWLNRQLSSAL